MQKQKKSSKQLKSMTNPIPQTYIKGIENVFIHPSQLIYIVIDTEGNICLFDVPTMSLVGKSYTKVEDGYKVYKCMFSKQDIGLFYTLSSKQNFASQSLTQNNDYQSASASAEYHYRLNMHSLNKKGEISCNTCEIDLNNSQQGKKQIFKKIQQQVICEKMDKIANPSHDYRFMEKERQQFIEQYYEENAQGPNKKRDLNLCQGGIGENLEKIQEEADLKNQGQDRQGYDKKMQQAQEMEEWQGIENEDRIMKEIENNEQNVNQVKNDDIEMKMQIQQKQEIGQEQNLVVIKSKILEISAFTRNPSLQSFLEGSHLIESANRIQYTILSTTGLEICSLHSKLQDYQIAKEINNSIIAGINVLGNDSIDDLVGEYSDVWVLVAGANVYIVSLGQPIFSNNFSQNPNPSMLQQSTPILHSTLNTFSTLTQIVTNNSQKKLLALLTNQNQILLISYNNLELQMVWRTKLQTAITQAQATINMNSNVLHHGALLRDSLNFVTFVNFGVNTSTTNKYENKIVIMVALKNVPDADKEKEKDIVSAIMQEENRAKDQKQLKNKNKQKEQKPSSNVYIFCIETVNKSQQKAYILPTKKQLDTALLSQPQVGLLHPQSQTHTEHLITVFKDFPLSRCNPWFSQYLQNKLNYINEDCNVQMIDLCRILEGKSIGKEWVNLGYRFQALEANELYEELEDQFEYTAEQNVIGTSEHTKNKIGELNDWSYCLLPRSVILNRTLKRLALIDL